MRSKDTDDASAPDPVHMKAEDLDDRHIRGVELAKKVALGKVHFLKIGTDRTIYWSSKGSRAYDVTRSMRNKRGNLAIDYRCNCSDFRKNGRTDCYHIVCDKIVRKELVIDGEVRSSRRMTAVAVRRPARKQQTADGRSYRTAQRAARVKMEFNVPKLAARLMQADDILNPCPLKSKDPMRALAVLLKVIEGRSADAMIKTYEDHINSGLLGLPHPPHQNSVSNWINSPTLTPILHRWLLRSAWPFRRCEVSAILDSTSVSQLRSASHCRVAYSTDERENAKWTKCHTIIGAETNIVMDVAFSGGNAHDTKYFQGLVESARRDFALEHVLADKGYLSENNVGWLWDRGIKAIIPVKKEWKAETKEIYFEACQELVQWYDHRQYSFHEAFRFRVKIESLFSHLKRISDGYCWSRGRPRQAGSLETPCDAWINELLCKFIYINLRSTVTREEMTALTIDYLALDKYFPMPLEPLIAA
jgi:hypothetical protein